MKKFAILLLILFAGIGATRVCFAEDQSMDDMGMKGKMMKGGGMQHPSMVATPDGGVIVLSGPRLTKYDKDLNLVKEVELKPGPKPPMDMKEPMSEPMQEPPVIEPPTITAPPVAAVTAVPPAENEPAPAAADDADAPEPVWHEAKQ